LFYKKYIFETRYTRSQRVLRNSLIGILGLCVGVVLLCAYIPIYASNQNEISEQAFFQRAPDVIAVFTGDAGRIAHSLKKAELYPSAKLFITGVYAKNSLKTLLHKQGANLSVDQFLEQEGHHIELDYLARNTVENALATFRYLKKMDGSKNVLIISSDYHIFRIRKILDTLADDDEVKKYNFYFESIKSDYTKKRNLRKLFKEVYKFVKASTFLMFWDREMPMIN
jgi:uncharacterized SAM-binding protein YcdF (DUF218 family)